ncbi:hypothetical protein PybrP1_005479 [[Pythium] brassicae (nom. inval.)]|nr:hypothetical protein PybrP1_005479 [[Pythium] brassicae (nom. inval.)]
MTRHSNLARALTLLLARALLTRAEVKSLLHASSCARGAVLRALAADASLGREALPIAVETQAASASSLRALFLSFAYETHCRCPVPLERHALAAAPHDALAKRVAAGRRVNVALRHRDDDARGWGVVALERIPRGSFVGEYTGALVSTREMQRRFREARGRNYVLVLREVARQAGSSASGGFSALRTIVDATVCGNFTRLVNHSCEPNLTITAVRVDSLIPRLVLFASRDIARGEELTFDYAGDAAGPSEAESYDDVCDDATSAAESRLLEHFKLHGGDVWTIGDGCQSCRQKLGDVSTLKKCVSCQAALFCDRECQLKGWKAHKAECGVIAAFRKTEAVVAAPEQVATLLEILSWSAAATKSSSEPKVVGVAKSLSMDEAKLPGWFFTVDYELASTETQKSLYQAALTLYALLRDEESWTRDQESFPRSSYTSVALLHSLPAAEELLAVLLARNGHLLLFSAWLQQPEPPATQSLPLEDRGFFGVVDSLLQLSAVRDRIDEFMDSRAA